MSAPCCCARKRVFAVRTLLYTDSHNAFSSLERLVGRVPDCTLFHTVISCGVILNCLAYLDKLVLISLSSIISSAAL